MFTFRPLITGVTIVAASVGAAATLATTGTASAGTAVSPRATSFTVRGHHGSETNLDLGKSGFSAGDQDLFTGSLTRNGTHAGSFVGTCTTVRVGKASADQLCTFVLHLAHGQIMASGTTRSGKSGPGAFALPILGGTGHYQTAAGQIAVTATNGNTFPIAVTLR
ncbi:MAG TPA: hypothetical protein VHW64_04965 [Nocardioides sp.]|jgi:hypothetical protein|uniref:hypothetical protein n=1 Tax=Nocardioides sp. TaxID=35761 RepID=UPI002E36C888|nr:hypothetical protein [Nocardioides sp.]HEX3930031.1 hypothetical protein [Nocardioides sp.]